MKRQILNLVRRLFFLYSEKKRKSKNLYRYINFEQIENTPIEKINRIIFIVPGIEKYSGGHTSILRLGTQLSKEYKIYMQVILKRMKMI